MDDSVNFESLRKVIFLRKVLWNLKLKKCFWLTVIAETWLRPQVGYERKVRLEGEKIYTMITRAAQPALFGTATKKLSILLETPKEKIIASRTWKLDSHVGPQINWWIRYGKGSKIVVNFEEMSRFFTLMLLKMVPRQSRELHWLAIKTEAVNMIKWVNIVNWVLSF